jgi:hypothetical protein
LRLLPLCNASRFAALQDQSVSLACRGRFRQDPRELVGFRVQPYPPRVAGTRTLAAPTNERGPFSSLASTTRSGSLSGRSLRKKVEDGFGSGTFRTGPSSRRRPCASQPEQLVCRRSRLRGPLKCRTCARTDSFCTTRNAHCSFISCQVRTSGHGTMMRRCGP